MEISKDLFLSILSMDAYNRGYNAGIGDSNVGLGESGALGAARLLARPNGIDVQEWRDAGFYAIAYQLTNRSQIDACNR